MNHITINQALQNAEAVLSEAEMRFNNKKSALDSKTANNINLNGTTALREVADIIQETKRLLEELYVTCQTQVRILDEVCRPLLNTSVSAEEVRSVWRMISRLNEKSEISVDFTASLNYTNLGDVAVVTYSPSLENKMTEAYWEATYKGWNGREELEKKEKIEEEKRKKEQKQARENAADKEAQQYIKNLAEWEKIEAAMLSERKKKLNESLGTEREALIKNAEVNFKAKEKELLDTTERCNRERADAEKALSATGSVNFIKKASLQKTIKKLTEQLEDTQKQLDAAKQAFEDEKKTIEKNLKNKESKLLNTLKKEYPIPRKPRQPISMKISNPTAYELASEGMKIHILDKIEKRGKISVTDLYSDIDYDLTYQNAKHILSELEKEGEIKKASGSTRDDPCYKLIVR